MLEVAKLGAHLLGSKVSLISSVGETQSPLGLFFLLGGPQSSSLGKSVPMPPCFFLFALLSQCHLLPGPSVTVLAPPHHTLPIASLLGLRAEPCTLPLSAHTSQHRGVHHRRLGSMWELKKPQEDTGNFRVTLGSGYKC